MEKLIELLNKYNKEIGKPKRMSEREVRTHYSWVICSGYGFIKWLVDNDKIDLEKLLKAIKENKIYCGKRGKTSNMLLMLLSIQDNPIEFLISILK